MEKKEKIIRDKIRNKINSNYLIVAIDIDVYYDYSSDIIDCGYNGDILSYTQIYNLIKNKNLFLIKSQNDYENHFNYCSIFIAYLSDKEVKLYRFSNSEYELIEYILNKFNNYKDRIIEKKIENIVGVRWLGAFNTNTTNKRHSFKECLNWEYSAKNREVACDVFSENIDFIYQYKSRVYNSYDNIYKRCKLAFVYSSNNIRIAYDCDIWSKQFGKMLVGSNENYNYPADNSKDFENLEFHAEGILEVGAKPQYLLIVDKNNWRKENLKIAEDFAIENNITVVYISSKLDKYSFDNFSKNIIEEDSKTVRNCSKDELRYFDFSNDYIDYLKELNELNRFEEMWSLVKY